MAEVESLRILSRNEASHYTWGEGFNTRGADGYFYVKVISGQPDPSGLVRIRTAHELGRGIQSEAREAIVEAEYLWPLLRGKEILPFKIESRETYFAISPQN